MEIEENDFTQSGLYLLFPGRRRIVLTREKIEASAHTFESNLDQIPVAIRRATAFQACTVCPEKDSLKFCHALPATLAFSEELKGFRSTDRVTAVYKGQGPGIVFVPNTTMQEALQFVAILSLMFYCEVGRKYWRHFLGIHPLLSPKEMIARIHLNIYWDCKGDRAKVSEVLRTMANEITCTCRCQVDRLRLVCKDDALINAFVNTQVQIEWLAMTKDAMLERSFEEFMKNG